MDLYNLFVTAELEKICKNLNINFINLTNDLRNRAKQELIHGPNDWTHFNIKGHKYIAELIDSNILK